MEIGTVKLQANMNYVKFQSKIMLKASRLFVFRARGCFV